MATEFLYKFRNNILGTNQRVAHFKSNHPVKCNSLCIANNEPLPVLAESLKVHKIENFFGSEFEFYTISLLVMLKY
jgi:hypothetical protein